MLGKLEYFLRLFCPGKLYDYSTKVRIPQNQMDFRKFLIAKFVLGNSGSAIDGGAHIGYYTRYFSDIIGEKGKVYSFEPNPYMFRLLDKYTRFHGNIISCQKALSNATTKSTFYVEPFSLSQDSTLGKGRADQKKIRVETVAMDDVLSPAEKIRLIKLDIEGHEMQAILGAKQLIQRCQPWIIFEYVQNESRNDHEIISLLEGWKYSCLDLRTLKSVPQTIQVDLTDVVAIPEGEMGKFIETLRLF